MRKAARGLAVLIAAGLVDEDATAQDSSAALLGHRPHLAGGPGRRPPGTPRDGHNEHQLQAAAANILDLTVG